MTRIKQLLTMALLLAVATTMSAQDKLFTLEDLNFGGTNYRRMLPKNMWLTWWGEQLMYQDAEEGGSIDAKGNRKVLFTLEEVNKITVDNGITFHSAMNASYPYPDQSLVLLDNGTERVLYDFRKKSVAWRQDSKGQLQELLQKDGGDPPSYAITGTSGPPHAPVFEAAVYRGSEMIGTGTGKTKKQAEQAAAVRALENLKAEEG